MKTLADLKRSEVIVYDLAHYELGEEGFCFVFKDKDDNVWTVDSDMTGPRHCSGETVDEVEITENSKVLDLVEYTEMLLQETLIADLEYLNE